jgi:hypothetical protein
MITYLFCEYVFGDVERAMRLAKQRQHFDAMLDRLCIRLPHPNPLSILMRAVNRLWLSVSIKQPCWRTGRWKSLT